MASAPIASSAPAAAAYTVSSRTSRTFTTRRGSSANAWLSCDALAARAAQAAASGNQDPPTARGAVGIEGVATELRGGARQHRRVRGPEPNGEHPHTAVGRLPRRGARIHAGGGGAVGEQHHHVGHV